MRISRDIISTFKEWKDAPKRKPILLQGARQIGKTWAMETFGKESFEYCAKFDFDRQEELKSVFQNTKMPERIIKELALFCDVPIIAGKTLIIFDEIQEYPDIATTLKSFKLDGKYDVICSGSMLGINYKTINSNSVGYKTDYEMRSFDFEEFLLAKGYSQTQIDSLLLHMQKL